MFDLDISISTCWFFVQSFLCFVNEYRMGSSVISLIFYTELSFSENWTKTIIYITYHVGYTYSKVMESFMMLLWYVCILCWSFVVLTSKFLTCLLVTNNYEYLHATCHANLCDYFLWKIIHNLCLCIFYI